MKKVVVEIHAEIERNFHWQFIPSPVENNIQLSCGDFSFRGKKSYEIVDVTNCSRDRIKLLSKHRTLWITKPIRAAD
ncbi:hypothetical protein HZH68_014968 [Vespula germanica]|uniref:Uncharacterized protein n=1 Tax=Vespula germanica TaxID=30212 RepID=A0A834MTJ2_VESGE|nr:hypothetical protein HZH68_014968 [Vespula germanica]